MVRVIENRAPQNFDAEGKTRPRGLDDSEGTAATVFSTEDIGYADEPQVTRPSVVIHEDDSVHFKSLMRVASNLKDLVLAQELHQADMAGGIDGTTTNRSDCYHQAATLNDEMLTIQEECQFDSEGGVGVPQDNVCETPQKQVKNPSKRKVHWGVVLVRDYPMILGDNPSCSCGPPLTLDWEYQEYKPLDVDTCEFHHPPRRSMRELARNYYQRKNLLYLAGFTDADFKKVKKEVNRVKLQRSITRSVATTHPLLFKVADATESAGRKCKRLLKGDHWKSQKSLYSAM